MSTAEIVRRFLEGTSVFWLAIIEDRATVEEAIRNALLEALGE